MDLLYYWNEIYPYDENGLRQIRFPAECNSDLYLGVNDNNNRCLLLYVPKGSINKKLKAKTYGFANISLEFQQYEGYESIIVELKNIQQAQIFDDFLYSLYNSISEEKNPEDTASTFVEYFIRWSSFFEPINSVSLSKQEVRGLIAELIILQKLLLSPLYCNNETLYGWRGPYGDEKDFFVDNFIIEVKSIPTSADEIRISSEYQLEKVAEKDLLLAVVELNETNEGFRLQDKYLEARSLIISNSLDLTAFLSALRELGVNQQNISEYDQLRFDYARTEFYNACSVDFPAITKSRLSSSIKNVSYNIVLSNIGHFKVNFL